MSIAIISYYQWPHFHPSLHSIFSHFFLFSFWFSLPFSLSLIASFLPSLIPTPSLTSRSTTCDDIPFFQRNVRFRYGKEKVNYFSFFELFHSTIFWPQFPAFHIFSISFTFSLPLFHTLSPSFSLSLSLSFAFFLSLSLTLALLFVEFFVYNILTLIYLFLIWFKISIFY